ncbi:ataxin-7-like protein 1 isoform X2 [Phymastichus coffea]|uniref:ataxin-7-like protein 1 isoform X2 n=1 Tax=Phymastichus coffea TaxID=108790 RepID=UPI00273C2E1E|nr:ataxin-7-like protein 1 isoform X2 [Phymastichus coffea]
MSGSDSPTFFHGQPWSSWIEKIGRDKPLSDEEPDSEPASSVMRLSVDDVDLYGFCPERDTFYGVVCEICNTIVKPQALTQHLESRHPSGHSNAAGQTNNAAVAAAATTGAGKALMKTPYCKLSKLKKSQSSGQLSVNNLNGTSINSASSSGGNNKTNSNNIHTPIKQQSQQQSQSLQQQSTNSNSSPRSPLESCGPGLGGGSPVKSPNNNSNNASSSSAQQPKRKRLKTERSLLKDREYDPDRHCGVWNDETGKPCTRSLTCKAHTVSLRRTVTGRSKAFDKLLAEHRASKEPQNQARTAAAAAAATAKVATAELAVAPSTPAALPPANNPELEVPSSPPVLSLPDTYPLPQTKLEEDFANELESSRKIDTSVVNNVNNPTNVNNSTNTSVMAPMSMVLPSLSPIQTDGLSPQGSMLQFSSRNVSNNSNSPMSADQAASTPVVPTNQQQHPNEAKTAPPMDMDTSSQGITMYTLPASKSQVTVQISRSSQRNNVVANNYSSLFEQNEHHVMTNGKRAKIRHEEYSPNIQLVETVTPYTNFDDISWSNCHPEPLAVSRWLRINSSRKQYNFNIH